MPPKFITVLEQPQPSTWSSTTTTCVNIISSGNHQAAGDVWVRRKPSPETAQAHNADEESHRYQCYHICRGGDVDSCMRERCRQIVHNRVIASDGDDDDDDGDDDDDDGDDDDRIDHHHHHGDDGAPFLVVDSKIIHPLCPDDDDGVAAALQCQRFTPAAEEDGSLHATSLHPASPYPHGSNSNENQEASSSVNYIFNSSGRNDHHTSAVSIVDLLTSLASNKSARHKINPIKSAGDYIPFSPVDKYIIADEQASDSHRSHHRVQSSSVVYGRRFPCHAREQESIGITVPGRDCRNIDHVPQPPLAYPTQNFDQPTDELLGTNGHSFSGTHFSAAKTTKNGQQSTRSVDELLNLCDSWSLCEGIDQYPDNQANPSPQSSATSRIHGNNGFTGDQLLINNGCGIESSLDSCVSLHGSMGFGSESVENFDERWSFTSPGHADQRPISSLSGASCGLDNFGYDDLTDGHHDNPLAILSVSTSPPVSSASPYMQHADQQVYYQEDMNYKDSSLLCIENSWSSADSSGQSGRKDIDDDDDDDGQGYYSLGSPTDFTDTQVDGILQDRFKIRPICVGASHSGQVVSDSNYYRSSLNGHQTQTKSNSRHAIAYRNSELDHHSDGKTQGMALDNNLFLKSAVPAALLSKTPLYTDVTPISDQSHHIPRQSHTTSSTAPTRDPHCNATSIELDSQDRMATRSSHLTMNATVDDDDEEIHTKELAKQVSVQLKKYGIPQAVFAHVILARSQGTLSDLLRNPKPWKKLKSGRETFKKMWDWLQEPELERMTYLRSAVNKRKISNQPEDNVVNAQHELKKCFSLDGCSSHDKTTTSSVSEASLPRQLDHRLQLIEFHTPTQSTGQDNDQDLESSDLADSPKSVSPRKRSRLVFTDIQRRTLQAIFRETKRPSKEMQLTIARQLGLEVSTVSNFFMNARRRSMDKWMDDNGYDNDGSKTDVGSNNTAVNNSYVHSRTDCKSNGVTICHGSTQGA